MPRFSPVPAWMQKVYPKAWWSLANEEAIYLTFDDGPHPEITPWAMDQLENYGFRGTFFCVGNNVHKYPETFQAIIERGHGVGSHCFHHENGWKTGFQDYLDSVHHGANVIGNKLFRPPHGKLTYRQYKRLKNEFQLVMWSVLSGDYDQQEKPENLLRHCLEFTSPGDIVVMHDSEKAWENLKYILPEFLKHCKQKGWQVIALPKSSR